MFGYVQDEYDKKVYEEQIQDFLPDKIIDIHNHVYKKEFARKTPRVSGIVAWTSMVASEYQYKEECAKHSYSQ